MERRGGRNGTHSHQVDVGKVVLELRVVAQRTSTRSHDTGRSNSCRKESRGAELVTEDLDEGEEVGCVVGRTSVASTVDDVVSSSVKGIKGRMRRTFHQRWGTPSRCRFHQIHTLSRTQRGL